MSTADAKAAAQKARHELAAALDGIEDKFSVKKRAEQVGATANQLSGKAVAAYKENPIPFIVGAAAVGVIAIVLVAWAIFGGDDD